MPENVDIPESDFNRLELSRPVLDALREVGYEKPSPIQAQIIPHILKGRDVLGQAQTGSGKTAAFALPILTKLDPELNRPQVLVLAPTRELAIQVAEAFHKYAMFIKDFHVLPIYGGQDFRTQLKQLKRGPQVIVGTPGRVMDHMRRGTLKLDALNFMVLDEADEMLRMGFIDDVEWILEQTPEQRNIALFSATMPTTIRRIAERHLDNPEQIRIKVKTETADTIRQRYWKVSGLHKLDALTRILEVEPFDGMVIFVRTKTASTDLAEKLDARGHSTAALNGDLAQNQREKTIERFKKGQLDILVATDVAARGLDLERISHVINFDIPYDTESYIHRIGRTGRAGRKGEAILFVSPRETRMLRTIEQATRKQIDKMELPSTEIINDYRIARFKQRITDTLAEDENLEFFNSLIRQYEHEHDIPAREIAAALAKIVQGDKPLLLESKPDRVKKNTQTSRPDHNRPAILNSMDRYRIEVGQRQSIKPGEIVAAICNAADIDRQSIGQIDIFKRFSIVELSTETSKEIFKQLKRTRLSGHLLNISKDTRPAPSGRKHIKKKGSALKHRGRIKKNKPASPEQ